MPTFNASPTTVSEVAAVLAAGVALWVLRPAKDQMAQVVGLSAGATYFLSKWVIEQDEGLFDLWEEGMTFATSAPLVFGLMWGGLIAVSYLEIFAAMGLAMFTGAEEVLLPVIEFLAPIRWILNPFSKNYAIVIIPTTFLIATLFSPIMAYPVFAALDATGNTTLLAPLGDVKATDPAAGFGGRGSAYGASYLVQDLFQLFLAYPLAAYGGGEQLANKKYLPLLTFPITGIASLFHRLGDVIYDFKFLDTNSLLTTCMGHWFDRPPVILDPDFNPGQYNNTCDPTNLSVEQTMDVGDALATKHSGWDTIMEFVDGIGT